MTLVMQLYLMFLSNIMIKIESMERWQPKAVCLETKEHGFSGIAIVCAAYGPLMTIPQLAPRVPGEVHRYQINFTDEKSATNLISEHVPENTSSIRGRNPVKPKKNEFQLIKSIRQYKTGDEADRKLMVLMPKNFTARQVDEYLLNLGDIEHIRTIHPTGKDHMSFSMVCFWNPKIAKSVFTKGRNPHLFEPGYQTKKILWPHSEKRNAISAKGRGMPTRQDSGRTPKFVITRRTVNRMVSEPYSWNIMTYLL